MDRYRDRRSPEHDRNRYQPAADNYYTVENRPSRPRSRSPRGYRPRSRSPRSMSDTWRGRPRSPPPPPVRYDDRADPYIRDIRPRSPRRDYPPDARYDTNVRPRSPPAPGRHRPRSPPRRPYSPAARATFRQRSRSPRRDDRIDPYAAKTWRRRSPSPRMLRGDNRPGEGSGRNSVNTSRRSSPRGYSRKPNLESYETEDPRGVPTVEHMSPARYREGVDVYGERPPRQPTEHEYSHNGNSFVSREVAAPPPEYRGPPTAPRHSAVSPPLGPSAGPPVSMSAHNRPDDPGMAGVPSQPRGSYRGRGGAPPPSRDWPPRDYSGPRRGGWDGNPVPYSSGRTGPPPPREPYPSRDPYFDSRGAPPSQPAAPHHRNAGGPGGGGPSFRGSSNSTSTTYPRTQRFNQALQDLPSMKEGGEKLPPLHDMTKADKLEEEAARLRKMIDEKESKKRQGLREWDRLERESSTMALKSELAEDHLRSLNGESEGVGAAF